MGRTSDARHRLIEAGRELMHERGYTAVGVAELCERAGVKKGSFYYMFPSKQELALEVIESFWDDARGMLDELAEGERPPLERLEAHLGATFEHNRESRDRCGRMLGCPFGNLATEMSTQDPAVREKLGEVFDRHVEHFEKLIADAVNRGDLPPTNIHASAQALLALIEGAVMLAKTHDNPAALKDLYRQALRLLGAPAPAAIN